MLYSDFVTELGVLLVVPVTSATSATPFDDTDLNNYLPRIIEGAEQRIYRELDFLNTRETTSSTTLSTSTRQFTMPTGVIILQSANVVTPSSTAPTAGTRVPLEITSVDFINSVWPQESFFKNVPEYVAMLSDTVGIVAPTADNAYTLEITGIFRPAPLSFSNTSTYITLNYPDLMSYAAMVLAAAYQRDYGASSDDPQKAVSWESMYQTAKQSALDEEQRRKSQSTNWSPYSAAPLSTPRK